MHERCYLFSPSSEIYSWILKVSLQNTQQVTCVTA